MWLSSSNSSQPWMEELMQEILAWLILMMEELMLLVLV